MVTSPTQTLQDAITLHQIKQTMKLTLFILTLLSVPYFSQSKGTISEY
jgi:hypothetical protein